MSPNSKKYSLEKEPSNTYNRTTYRIRALRDIPAHKVRAGDIGGRVESEHNLSHEGDAWIADAGTALDRSRVEGSALLKNYASIADHSLITGSAVVGSLTYMSGNAVAQDNCVVMGSSSIGGNVVVGGDVNIRVTTQLSGDGKYTSQDQVPWSFRYQDEREPDYLDRVIEATRIDPALKRVFTAMGADDDAQRVKTIRDLWEDPEGHKALTAIVQTIGGTFTPESYEPRSAAQIASDKAAKILTALYSPEYSDHRVLYNVRDGKGYEQPDGNTLYAGVVIAKTIDPETKLLTDFYQPALYLETAPDHPTLTPLVGTPMIVNEVYTSHIDASFRADSMLAAAIMPAQERVIPDAETILYGQRRDIDLSALPLIADSRIVMDEDGKRALGTYLSRLTIRTMRPDTSDLSNDLGGLSKPDKFAFVDLPNFAKSEFSFADIEKKVPFYSSPITAFQEAGYNQLYGNEADFLYRVAEEIAARETRIAALRDQLSDGTLSLSDAAIDKLDEERARLEPSGTAILMKVFSHKDAAAIAQKPSPLNWSDSYGSVGAEVAYSDIGGQSVTFRIAKEAADPASNKDKWSASAQQRSGITQELGFDSAIAAKTAAIGIHRDLTTQATQRDAALTFDGFKNALEPMSWSNCPNPNKEAPSNQRFIEDAFVATSLNTRFTVEKHRENDWSLYVDSPDTNEFSEKPLFKGHGYGSEGHAMEAAEAYRITMILDELTHVTNVRTPELAPDPNTFAAVSRKLTSDGTKYVPTHITLRDIGYSQSTKSETYSVEGDAARAAVLWLSERQNRSQAAITNDAAPARPAPASPSHGMS